MHFSLIRLIGILSLALTSAAIGLSRAVPTSFPSKIHAGSAARYVGVNGTMFVPPSPDTFLLDTENGQLSRLKSPEGIRIEYAVCAPSGADDASCEMLGRATTWIGRESDVQYQGTGLFRMAIPGPIRQGRLIFPPDLLIAGRPCLLPGSPSRVMFAAGNGGLYVQEFPREVGEAGKDEPPAAPAEVTWACPTPGLGSTMIADPIAPGISSLKNYVFVSLNVVGKGKRKSKFENPKIWWLKLDADAHEILGAGPLTPPDEDSVDERLPNLTATPDGRIVMAYLARRGQIPGWNQEIRAIEIDPSTSHPSARTAKAIGLGGGFSPNLPAFSRDGRWLFGIAREGPVADKVRRFSVIEAIDSRTEPRWASVDQESGVRQ